MAVVLAMVFTTYTQPRISATRPCHKIKKLRLLIPSGAFQKQTNLFLADDARNFFTYKQREQADREIDCHREREGETERE